MDKKENPVGLEPMTSQHAVKRSTTEQLHRYTQRHGHPVGIFLWGLPNSCHCQSSIHDGLI